MKRAQLIAILPLLALLGACEQAVGESSRHGGGDAVTVQRSWPAEAIETVEVSEVGGNITVEAADVSQITLVATARGHDLDLNEKDENRGIFETRIDGSTLKIGRERKRKGLRIPFVFGFGDIKIDYELKVPTRMALDVNTVNGRITTHGVDGECQATTVNGRLDIEATGRSELRATTVNGRVKAKFLTSFQGARFKTVNGSVTAVLPSNASFDIDLSQVNGDFEAAFPLSIHSNPGRRHVSGSVNGGAHELKIVTVNGDVELARLNEQ
jgi:DUF4097 and DUF4098 domain-containing protein YvlB